MRAKRFAAVIALIGCAVYFADRLGMVKLPGSAEDYFIAGICGALVLMLAQIIGGKTSHG